MSEVGESPHGPRITTAWALRGAGLCAGGLALTWVVQALVPVAHTRDAAALYGFTLLSRPRVDALAHAIAHLVDPWRYVLLGAGLIGVALVRRRPRVAAAVAVTLAGAVTTSELLKPLLAHSHDAAGHHVVFAASWPSGHSTAAMSLALCAVLVAPARLRPAAAALGSLFAVSVSFSLLTLAWHLPSDVVGGYLVAGLWTALAVGAVRAADARWPRRDVRAGAARAGVLARAAEALVPLAVVAATGMLVGAVVLLRPHEAAAFVEGHHSLVVAGVAIVALAGGLASVLAAALRR